MNVSLLLQSRPIANNASSHTYNDNYHTYLSIIRRRSDSFYGSSNRIQENFIEIWGIYIIYVSYTAVTHR